MAKVIDPAIGQRIRARREELGIGPGETCDKVHITPGMLNHLEQGKRMPSVSELLRCKMDYLVKGKREKPTNQVEDTGI